MPTRAHFAGRSVVRWGIIGCGIVTEVKSGPALQKASGSALTAVMRRNGALAADYAKRHGVPRSYDKAEALLADPEVDAVYIATPPGAHADYALMAAAAGKPAYVEKPMARNIAECDRMLAAFGAAGLPLYVAYYRRCLPRFTTAAEIVRSGVLGQVTGVQFKHFTPRQAEPKGWRYDAAQSAGGPLVDAGAHVLDLIDSLLGPLTEVAGNAANRATPGPLEDTMSVSFRAGGVPGVMLGNYAFTGYEDQLRICGTAGELSFSVFGREPIRLQTAKGVETFERPDPEHVQLPLIQTMVDDLLGRGTCPSTGETARRTSAVIDRVLDAYYGGRQDEFWNRPETWPGRRKS